MWKQAALYGLLLALGTLALQWFDYQRMARAHAGDIYDFLLATGFLALGLWIGARVLGRRTAAPAFDGNPRALAELGISPREVAVLREIAAGHSNKQIAANLHVSPNTVKTHVARLFEKWGRGDGPRPCARRGNWGWCREGLPGLNPELSSRA